MSAIEIPKASEAVRQQVLRKRAAVTELRQPMPDRCESPEGALALLRHDPSRSVQSTYALAYLDGWVAGRVYAFGGDMTREQVDRHTSAHVSRQRPLPLHELLADPRWFTWRDEDIADAAWLQGWKDATLDADGALECEDVDCARRLFADLDDTHRCEVDGGVFCAGLRQCWAGACPTSSPRHARECHDADGGL